MDVQNETQEGAIEAGSEVIETGDVGAENTTPAAAATETSGAESAAVDPKAAGAAEAEQDKNIGAKVGEDGEPIDDGYKPNLKYKVMDKEYEIPKKYADLMTDAESEKDVRDLFERATGLEGVKLKLTETRKERDTVSQEYGSVTNKINEVRGIYQKAVQSENYLLLDNYFSKLGIPHDVIMKYAAARVQLSELPPEQRQLISAQMSAEEKAETLEKQNRHQDERFAEQAQQIKNIQLNSTLEREEARAIAEAFDAQVGRPGALRDAVIQQGMLAWHTRKVDLTPEQALEEVVKNYGLKALAPQSQVEQPQVVTQPGQATKKVVQRQSTTIPNVHGKGGSPLKQKPRSIEDLKQLHKSYSEAN